MLVWYRCHSMIRYTKAVKAVIWHRPRQAAVHHYKPKSVLHDQSIKTWKTTANMKIWCMLWFITYRLNCLSVSVCVVCLECVNHKNNYCFVADDKTTVTLIVCLVEESEHICKSINERDWECPPGWACWPLSAPTRGTSGIIPVSRCWTVINSTFKMILCLCVCTTVCSHPPVQLCLIDNHACMLPLFMDCACICVCSTYGVHSLGKASISSCVYSLSFLGISRGWGSSSVRFARMSSGSSWWAVVGEGGGGWTGQTRNKRADCTFQSM